MKHHFIAIEGKDAKCTERTAGFFMIAGTERLGRIFNNRNSKFTGDGHDLVAVDDVAARGAREIVLTGVNLGDFGNGTAAGTLAVVANGAITQATSTALNITGNATFTNSTGATGDIPLANAGNAFAGTVETPGEVVLKSVLMPESQKIVQVPFKVFRGMASLAAVKDRLAGYKKPKRVFFIDEMPKTVSGKIIKKDLRERFKNA